MGIQQATAFRNLVISSSAQYTWVGNIWLPGILLLEVLLVLDSNIWQKSSSYLSTK
jgi:hypothetical protein